MYNRVQPNVHTKCKNKRPDATRRQREGLMGLYCTYHAFVFAADSHFVWHIMIFLGSPLRILY